MERAIAENRNRAKYRRLALAIRRRTFDYADAGKLPKAEALIYRAEMRSHGIFWKSRKAVASVY